MDAAAVVAAVGQAAAAAATAVGGDGSPGPDAALLLRDPALFLGACTHLGANLLRRWAGADEAAVVGGGWRRMRRRAVGGLCGRDDAALLYNGRSERL
jgi:hypothetical protein